MALKAYQFVGLKNPVYLPDDIQVEISIIPAGNTNVRSNTKRAASDVRYVTRHETANFNAGADADMHYRYLMSNPDPAAGYNTVSDDRKVRQLTPYDEVTWAAGTYNGNLTSDHHELCVQAGIDHAKARRIAAAVDAGVLHARGLTPQEGLLQHNYWTGKNCPLLMRADNNAIWNGTYYPMVKAMYADIVAHVSAPQQPTAPEYASAIRIMEADDSTTPVLMLSNGSVLIHAPLKVEAVKDTARLQTAWAGSKPIGPPIPKGETFEVHRLIINADGTKYWYTAYATRVRFDDTRIVGVA